MCYARRQRSSWARIKLSNEWYLKPFRTLNLFLSSYDSLFYFLLSSILFQNFRVPLRTYYMLVLSSLLFNFQWPFPLPRFGRAWLLYHFNSPLSIPFSKVFSTFFKAFFSTLELTACTLYYGDTSLSTPFFNFFKKILTSIFEVKKMAKNIFKKFQKTYWQAFSFVL